MADGLLGNGDLLGKHGLLNESGYAFSQVKSYSRSAAKPKLRIKEWDYYSICLGDYAIALTVADNSYMSLASVSVIDFKHIKYITKSKIGLFSMGKLGMPQSCYEGNVKYKNGGVSIEFDIDRDGRRTLKAEYKKFDGNKAFKCEIDVEPHVGDNITVAIPFGKKRRFYYNTKINCLKCNGWFSVGDERHEIVNAFGGLDWGRGVWTYKNTWYWSSMSCETDDGKTLGLNLGYGFGKPTESENVVFYDGKGNKLDKVTFDIPYTQGKIDYLKPWRMTDNENRLELTFYPMIDRKDKMNVGVLSTDQHQVFGRFYGKVVLDDGMIVNIDDKIGFAEKVVNKW
ncbi:MAG: DUF2804 domain-containing protein [Clostridiales bacterium]|nr:DUF2804 domain-containing protein [Clostridiales bacterium]